MAQKPFRLQDILIAYGADKRAVCVTQPREKLGDLAADFVLGAFAFRDDASVHADHWERHPAGDEILHVIEGRLLVAVERAGGVDEVVVERDQGLIVPRGAWHRLEVIDPGRLLVLTPRTGTELRPHPLARHRNAQAIAL